MIQTVVTAAVVEDWSMQLDPSRTLDSVAIDHLQYSRPRLATSQMCDAR